jgi:RNA polymerase sigma-70 factor (ECF subfamily)
VPIQITPNSRQTSNPRPTARASSAATEAEIDAGLVLRFKAGDEPAFVTIMERYRRKIFSVAFGLLRNRTDAEEITQDTFIRAHRALADFRGDSSLATWLHRIAVNLSRNRYWYFRRRRRHDSLSLDFAIGTDGDATFADLIADTEQGPAELAAASEFTALVEACMAELDPGHREILKLRNVLNRSYEEIATTLGINVGTVKSRIARARETLRTQLAAACPEFAPDAEPTEWFLPKQGTYGRPAIAACA